MIGRSPAAGLTREAQVSLTVLSGQEVMDANQHATDPETAVGARKWRDLRGQHHLQAFGEGVR